MKSNFLFLKTSPETQKYYSTANYVEKCYVDEEYEHEMIPLRKSFENLTKDILEKNNISVNKQSSFHSNLMTLKNENVLGKDKLNIFFSFKNYGNKAVHSFENRGIYTRDLGLQGVKQLHKILGWFFITYINKNAVLEPFEEPRPQTLYSTAERKLIYIQNVDNSSGKLDLYKDLNKVGDATSNEVEADWSPNSDFLHKAADKRIKNYMGTSGLPYEIQWAEMAWREYNQSWFRDHDVHRVLKRSNIKNSEDVGGKEWFKTDVATIKRAITAVKEGRSAIDVSRPDIDQEISLRPEQKMAIKQTEAVFKKSKRMLWNAKMRFGKTLSALELIKRQNYQRILIMTHRPVVSDSWSEDFYKIKLDKEGYKYSNRSEGETLDYLLGSNNPFIYFASIQDLRGSSYVGGKVGSKNELIFETDWDLVIIDEAHEGTQTPLADNIFETIIKKDTRLLELSGTPFNLLDQYDDNQVYTWDYVMEQEAKAKWEIEKPDEFNPYDGLPKISMYTFEMNNQQNYQNEQKSFNFKEFFRVNDDGDFVHYDGVYNFLNEITNPNENTNYPFSKKEFRDNLRHTLWLLPGVKEATALKKLMDIHPVFSDEFTVINIVEDGEEIQASTNDLQRVRRAITDNPSETKTITLTVRKLTTGVNIKEWNAVVFLNNMTSAMQYMQAAFRAQTPFSDKVLGKKTHSYIFDFAPDRALTIMAETKNLKTKVGKRVTDDQKLEMQKLLNFLPIIGIKGNKMQEYGVESLLTKLKRVYAEKAIRSGFEDESLYSDELLLNIDEKDFDNFNNLREIVGTTNKKKLPAIPVNKQGLTNEEYEKAEKAKRKKKKQRSQEELEAIEKVKALQKQRSVMISILRSVSIRIPMMIYGMNFDINEDIDLASFIQNVDQKSWEEFMPAGVTKEKFAEFTKYYDPEVFIEAGRIIRTRVKELDILGPIERAEDLSLIFNTFKNPDKETVLTPWKVVNTHMGTVFGGLSFYDEYFKQTIKNGKNIRRPINTEISTNVFKQDVAILDINSKTGLYPLYSALSIYYAKLENMNKKVITSKDEQLLWNSILEKNIYVIAKTPMAATITERTLAGFKRNVALNIKYIDNIVESVQTNKDKGLNLVEEAFDKMKFDVVIGNPPYQESDNNSSKGSSKPIYHHFMRLAKSLNPEYISLITPSVWFIGGKGLDEYRYEMLNDPHLKSIYNYVTPKDVFPSANLRGGVSFFLWDKSYNNVTDNIKINTIKNNKTIETGKRPITLDNLNILISSNTSFSIIRRLIENDDISLDENSNSMLKQYVSVRNPYGFETKFKNSNLFKDSSKNLQKPIKIYASKLSHGFIEKNTIKRKIEWINKIKVITPFANNIGTDLNDDNLNTIVAGKDTITTETYLTIGADLDLNMNSAENLSKYLKTKFVRFLISLAKANQNGTRSTYLFVPLQDFSNKSDINWKEDTANIDIQLFNKYNFNEKEILHVNSSIQDMRDS